MNARIKALALSVLKTDTFPKPIPERLRDKAELNDPVAVAEGMRRYLLKQPIELRKNELIADRYRYSGCEYPADYYKSAGHYHKNEARYRCCSETHPNDLYYWGWTHVALDYGYILQNGLASYLHRIDSARKTFQNDAAKIAFLSGMEIALHAVAERGRLVAIEARKQAELLENADVRQNYLAIAEAMEWTPMRPARNFFEAVQCVWTMFLVAPDSLGRMDQYLLPFYRREMEMGTLKRDHAKELLQEMFAKVHESQVDNLPQPHSGHNHLVVGGYLQNGEDGFNELSVLILECIAELPTFRPQASFRYTAKTTPETMRIITEFNRRCPLIVFVNDEPRIRGMVDSGIAFEDAIEYTVLGCNEWAICGKSRLDLAHINLVHSLKTVLYDRRAELLTMESFEQVYALFEECLEKDIRSIVSDYEAFYCEQARDINVLTSALMDDCIEKARPFNADGPRYYGLTMSFNGISNVVDSLSILADFVLTHKKCTIEQLLAALDANWQGDFSSMRTQILRHGRFFGNDDALPDGIAQQIVTSIDTIKKKIQSPAIQTVVCGSFVGATHPNIILGKKTPATPDGRMCGEELTMGISQTGGKDKKGVTALLKSISSLDYSRLCGCVVSNLKLDPRTADTPEKLERIARLFHAFLMRGGMQLQINYLSGDELRQAQITPEDYENLMVRVTGYSGYFTLFNHDLQDDIIKRTEHPNV